jgi:plastocyanin
MSQRTLRLGLAGILGVLALCGLVVAALAGTGVALAPEPTPTRSIVLEARDVAFYLVGDPSATANPTLRVLAGESLALTLINRDAGIAHDLAAGSERAIVPPFADTGERTVTWTAPDEPGTYEYVCTLHAQRMRGTLEVAPAH